jgi:hypothetical protein
VYVDPGLVGSPAVVVGMPRLHSVRSIDRRGISLSGSPAEREVILVLPNEYIRTHIHIHVQPKSNTHTRTHIHPSNTITVFIFNEYVLEYIHAIIQAQKKAQSLTSKQVDIQMTAHIESNISLNTQINDRSVCHHVYSSEGMNKCVLGREL